MLQTVLGFLVGLFLSLGCIGMILLVYGEIDQQFGISDHIPILRDYARKKREEDERHMDYIFKFLEEHGKSVQAAKEMKLPEEKKEEEQQ